MEETTVTVTKEGKFLCLREVEKRTILTALTHHGGNISETARALKISRSSMYRKAECHGISLTNTQV